MKLYEDSMVAKVLGINPGVYSKYINGKIIPKGKTLDRHNDTLEEKLKELLKAEEPEQQEYQTSKQEKDMAGLRMEIAELHKKTDRILDLLEKKK